MQLVDLGQGPPVVLLPGVQGRWEWHRPAVAALAARCRVLTFSYADEPTSGARFDAADGFSSYVEQVAAALDQAGLARAVVCGVSYGGLVASAFAVRYPQRTAGLALVSAIPPAWRPDARVRFYLRAPWLLSPIFCLASLRMYREIAAAVPGRGRGLLAAGRIGARALAHMFSPPRMARRATLLPPPSLEAELARLRVPAIVVTGDAALDRVVPVRLTRQYLDLLPQATWVTLERTGHIGLVTRPDVFARVIGDFAALVAPPTGTAAELLTAAGPGLPAGPAKEIARDTPS